MIYILTYRIQTIIISCTCGFGRLVNKKDELFSGKRLIRIRIIGYLAIPILL